MGKIKEYKFKKKVNRKLNFIISILDELIGETESVEDSVITLLQGIQVRLNELIVSELDLEATKAKLVELTEDLNVSELAVAEAVANFTPPAP